LNKWVCYYCFNSFYYFSLGFHFSFIDPNLEIHMPFGFIRIGRVPTVIDADKVCAKIYGYDKKWKWSGAF